MLWYKGWLETRLKVLLVLGFIGFILFTVQSFTHTPKSASQMMQTTVPTFIMMFCAVLAGAGIATQPPLQATKGLHGSILFTLSLPVSRLRLIAVRAAIGWLEVAAAIGIVFSALWFLTPALRTIATPLGMFELGITAIAWASSIYSLSVLLATFLDDVWRIWVTMLATVALGWLARQTQVPGLTDMFLAVGKNSPLFTHIMPWAGIVFAVALAIAFFLAALQVAQAREY
jgi:hypothetical protein